jgi:hypothetical protein
MSDNSPSTAVQKAYVRGQLFEASGLVPSVKGLIVLRQDRQMWDQCCSRLGLDPKDRALRYFHVDGYGINLVRKGAPDILGPWLYGNRTAGE